MIKDTIRKLSSPDNLRKFFMGPIYPILVAIIVTADHGGHDRMHGTEMEEDMTIPMFYRGPAFEKGKQLENISLLDIAPTIADLLGAMPSPEWEGRSLV